MKTHPLTLFILVALLICVFALLLPAAAAAQGSTPPASGPSGYHPPEPTTAPDWQYAEPAAHARPSTSAPQASAASAPTIATGQPGLSYRYVRTFGETEVAYLADTTHVNFPYGIATDGTNVWIGESFGHRALKFTSTGTFVSAIGTAGGATGPVWEIADLAVDSGGNTWIVDGGQVIKFDAAGNEVSRLWRDADPNTHLQIATGIAFDSAGNIYVSDGAPWWSLNTGNHRIQVFDPAGNYLATIGSSGTAGAGNLQFHGPHHIAIYDNLLYVTDGGNHRVQIINVANPHSPAYVGTIGTTGEGGEDNAHFSNPSGVAVDANYLYVADRWNHRVQVFARGTRSYVATLGSYGSGNGQFWEPTDVAVDTLGNLYVADFVNTRVQQFDKNRTYLRTYGVARVPYLTDDYHYNNPIGVAAAADGSLYIAEDNGHRLVKLNAGWPAAVDRRRAGPEGRLGPRQRQAGQPGGHRAGCRGARLRGRPVARANPDLQPGRIVLRHGGQRGHHGEPGGLPDRGGTGAQRVPLCHRSLQPARANLRPQPPLRGNDGHVAERPAQTMATSTNPKMWRLTAAA